MASSMSHLITNYFLLLLIPYAASLAFDLPNLGPGNQNREILVEGNGAYISNSGIQIHTGNQLILGNHGPTPKLTHGNDIAYAQPNNRIREDRDVIHTNLWIVISVNIPVHK
ncbi:hypothetical protein OSB04_016116 [Centaurea solstitialis]|uniref:Uncharacterized protein n=1 Tax=Centaurea solstitialis TaxID=347529 RepID=A0AA38TBE2_9ASTR|nr:hypothetical protein OSB04_016116 [Centaurea solstitialis]